MVRATTSTDPPGGYGTTSRTTFDGNGCAAASAANNVVVADTSMSIAGELLRVFIDPPSLSLRVTARAPLIVHGLPTG